MRRRYPAVHTPLQTTAEGAMNHVTVTRATTLKAKPPEGQLGFGTYFTDHMLLADYRPGSGWGNPRITPYGPLSLDPAAKALHYAQAVFDGLKAFRGVDGRVRLFRPLRHFARLERSAEALCIPALDPEMALDWLLKLLRLEVAWTPAAAGTALYVRPVIIATEPSLGVRPSETYLYYVLLSPVGAYFQENASPLHLLVEAHRVRAVPGGIGAAKAGANYAAALRAGEQARRAGFAQVLWLDGVHHRYLDEAGSMNVMLRIDDEVVTPPLNGAILAGVTRDAAITLLRGWGVQVTERPIAIEEVTAAARSGALQEVWGLGTAAVVAAVGQLPYRGECLVVNGGRPGPVAQRLSDTITGIQCGRLPDPDAWMLTLPESP